jgi:hypothetical protein
VASVAGGFPRCRRAVSGDDSDSRSTRSSLDQPNFGMPIADLLAEIHNGDFPPLGIIT